MNIPTAVWVGEGSAYPQAFQDEAVPVCWSEKLHNHEIFTLKVFT
jgi:hypothetical protein